MPKVGTHFQATGEWHGMEGAEELPSPVPPFPAGPGGRSPLGLHDPLTTLLSCQ